MSYQSLVKTKRVLRLLTPLAMVAALVAGNIPAARAAAPTVSVTAPTANTTQQGIFALSATASAGTVGVTFKVTGPYVSFTSAEDTTAPYSVNWDSSVGSGQGSLNKSDYTITAVARNALNQKGTSPGVKVKLNNLPLPNKVMVVGDSVSQQAFDWDADGTFNYTAGAPAAADLLASSATIHMGWAVPNVQDTVYNYSVYRWPQKFVVAMGLNDAANDPFFGGDGWTETGANNDLSRFQTLLNTVHSTTCVTLVLPGYLAGAPDMSPSYATEIDKARAALVNLAANRPHTITIDWQTVVNAHPEYMESDGIHLLTPGHTPADNLEKASHDELWPVDPVAAQARQNFYWDGAAQCTV